MKKAILLFILISLLLSGCIDIEHKVKINKDGSGSIYIAAISEPQFADALKNERLLEAVKPEVKVKNVMRGKKFYHTETLKFKNISDLVMEGEQLSIRIKGSGFLGFGKKDATFEQRMFSTRETDTSSADAFSGHYYNYTLELPGKIKKVYPLVLGGIEIEPTVEKNRITWNIPLDMMLKQKEIVIKVDFAGKLKFSKNLVSKIDYIASALEVAGSIRNASSKAEALSYIAKTYAGAGQKKRATEILSEAATLAGSIKEAYSKAWALADIAKTYAEAGKYDKALEVAGSIRKASSKARALSYIAKAYVGAGQKKKATEILSEAATLAGSIREAYSKAWALAGIASLYMKVESE